MTIVKSLDNSTEDQATPQPSTAITSHQICMFVAD